LFNLSKCKWVEELPKVVWSHNTIASRTTGFTPFKLLYGEEAMLPKEVKHQSLWVMKQALAADEEYSKEIIKGTRLEVVENITKYPEQTRKWRDSQVIRKLIQDRDLVLRRKPNAASVGKLQPKWDGPYMAKATGRPRSFYVIDGKGNTMAHI
jgi:hypothetical protein